MFTTYILVNETDEIYIGQTANLKERLERHNGFLKNKKTSYTYKRGGNWRVVYSEEYSSRSEALKREKELKSFRGREFIRKIILARC